MNLKCLILSVVSEIIGAECVLRYEYIHTGEQRPPSREFGFIARDATKHLLIVDHQYDSPPVSKTVDGSSRGGHDPFEQIA